MSIERRRTKAIYTIIQNIVSEGATDFRPGDVATQLRENGQPMEAWEIRGEFSVLQAEGLITLDKTTGDYALAATGSRKLS